MGCEQDQTDAISQIMTYFKLVTMQMLYGLKKTAERIGVLVQ